MVRQYFAFKIRNKVRTQSPTTSTLHGTGGCSQCEKANKQKASRLEEIKLLSLADDMILCRKS